MASPARIISDTVTAASTAAENAFPLDFTRVNPDAVAAASAQSARLVKEINQATRQGIAAATARGIKEGIPPKALARTIRSMVGLTSRQVEAVFNARAEWMEGGLTGVKLEKKVAAYSEKMLKTRAMTIARTETIFSLNTGQHAGWKRAVSEGLLDPARTQRRWSAAPGRERTCPICGSLNGTTTSFYGVFTFGVRSVEHPPIHPRCRCSVSLVFSRRK